MILSFFILWCLAYVLGLMTFRDLATCYLLLVSTMIVALLLLWAGVTHAYEDRDRDDWQGAACWDDDCPA